MATAAFPHYVAYPLPHMVASPSPGGPAVASQGCSAQSEPSFLPGFIDKHMAAGGEEASCLPPWLAPYAERLYERFPEVMLLLGHPSLPETFHVPPWGGSAVQIEDFNSEKVVRVYIGHKGDELPTADSSVPPVSADLSPAGLRDSEDVIAAALTALTAASGDSLPLPVNGVAAPTPPGGIPRSGCDLTQRPEAAGFPDAFDLASPSAAAAAVAAAAAAVAAAAMASASASGIATAPPQDGLDVHPTAGSQSQLSWPLARNETQRLISELAPEGPDFQAEPHGPRSPKRYSPWKSLKTVRQRGRSPMRSTLDYLVQIPVATDESGISSPQSVKSQASGSLPALGLPTLLPTPMPLMRASLTDELGHAVGHESSGSPGGEGPRVRHSLSIPSQFWEEQGTPMACDSPESATSPSKLAHDPSRSAPSAAWRLLKRSVASMRKGPGSPAAKNDQREGTVASLKLRRGITLTLGVGNSGASRPSGPSTAESKSSALEAPVFTSPTNGQKRMRKKDAGAYHSCTSPESLQPAVQLLPQASPASRGNDAAEDMLSPFQGTLPRPLPGAFPTWRTVFFFDWDDTLCPTSWIRSVLKGRLADDQEWAGEERNVGDIDWRTSVPGWFNQPLPDDHNIHDMIEEMQQAIINLIGVAQAFGIVCIVTNAVPGWVGKTIKKWLPQLTPYILGHGARPPIQVMYAQEHYTRNPGVADLQWEDDLGEYMWWKEAAMLRAITDLDDLYRLKRSRRPLPSWSSAAGMKRVTNIISMGDDEAEMKAATVVGHKVRNAVRPQAGSTARASRSALQRGSQLFSAPGAPSRGVSAPVQTSSVAALSNAARRTTSQPCPNNSRRPWVKLVKLRQCPHVKQVRVQLEEMAEMIPQVVAMRQNFQVDLGEDDPGSPRSPEEIRRSLPSCPDVDERLEASIRTQIV